MHNILESVTFYKVYMDKIADAQLKETIENEFGIDDTENQIASIDGAEIERYEEKFGYSSFGDAIDYASAEFDEAYLIDELTMMIGNWPHYLVFASGCRWNGASGYKITEKIEETVYRGYDISLYLIKEVTERGIQCTESSHDVPMGSTTYIVGITEDEYEMLCEAEFDEVEHFVKSIFD